MTKFCLLIIYSEHFFYRKMAEILTQYYDLLKKYNNNFSYYFVAYRNQPEKVMIESNYIYVNGKESLLNILYKTVEAFNYILNNDNTTYDFFIRTNISTVIEPNLLQEKLDKLENYGVYNGSLLFSNFNKLDYGAGVNGNIYLYKNFVSGTSIILSTDLVQDIVNNKHKLVYNLVDDVSIGFYLNTYHKNIVNKLTKETLVSELFFVEENVDLEKVEYDKIIFYRNHNPKNRRSNVINMNMICNKILEKYYK